MLPMIVRMPMNTMSFRLSASLVWGRTFHRNHNTGCAHATAVDNYVLDVFPVGADPYVAYPVGTHYLGKPPISNGEIRADISSTIQALAPGTYIATVTAVGLAGSARSDPSPPFTR